jgi:hypothetical protein
MMKIRGTYSAYRYFIRENWQKIAFSSLILSILVAVIWTAFLAILTSDHFIALAFMLQNIT